MKELEPTGVEPRGTFNCPICNWPEPHSHSEAEIAERPWIDGCRAAFEKEGREFMNQYHFNDVRTGYWWARTADKARTKEEIPPPFKPGNYGYGWGVRTWSNGPYYHELVEAMWQFWKKAWMTAKKRGVILEL